LGFAVLAQTLSADWLLCLSSALMGRVCFSSSSPNEAEPPSEGFVSSASALESVAAHQRLEVSAIQPLGARTLLSIGVARKVKENCCRCLISEDIPELDEWRKRRRQNRVS
jgi:hypothetical protein